MFKNLFYFTKLFLLALFLVSPSFTFAWNGMCFSPVQMAALMSKPKKSGVSTRKLNAQIRGLEKAIDKAYGQLDDAESLLEASLDQEKLKADPYDVARQIRDYIESSQDGWECDSSGQAFLSPLFFEILEQLLIPSAFGDEDKPMLKGADRESREPATASVGIEEQCKKSGGSWDKTNKRCVSKKEQCQRRRGNWTWDGSNCVSKEEECKKSGGSWDKTNKRCVSAFGNKGKAMLKVADRKSREPATSVGIEEQCKKSGGSWDKTNKRCVSAFGDKGKAMLKGADRENRGPATSVGIKEQCEKSGGSWDKTNKRCVSKKEQCESQQRTWNSKTKACCPKSKSRLLNGQCLGPEPKRPDMTEKQVCEANRRTWNSKTKACCPKSKSRLLNGQCLGPEPKRPDMTEKQVCEANRRTWNPKTKACCPKSKSRLLNGQCLGPEPKRPDMTEKQVCEANRRTWNPKTKACCPKSKSRLLNGQCLGPEPKRPDMTKKQVCEANRRTWNPKTKACCPKSKSRLLNGQCLGPEPKRPDMTEKQVCEANRRTWNPKTKACCPKSKSRLVDNQCLEPKPKKEPCPEWKNHKAFGRNGKVHSSFCDEYASNKRDCKRALEKIKKRARRISQLKDRETQLEDQLSEAQIASLKDSTKDTEANGLCFDCLKRVLYASRPTTGQNVGNALSLLAGVGMTAVGYNVGRRAQADVNMLRIQQGYDAQHDYYSLMGAGMGFPFMAQGLHGMTRTNTPAGGWDCSPTMSPYGHAHNYQYGQGFNMPYY